MGIRNKAESTKVASTKLAALNSTTKNAALEAIKAGLLENEEKIFEANRQDLERSRQENLNPPLIKRLKFQKDTLREVISGIDSLISIPDPIGEVLSSRELDDNLKLYKVRCSIGVIAMIFESRPDAAVQIATLALKSGNGILLKGGHEAYKTLRVLCTVIHDAACAAGFPPGWLYQVESREDVNQLLQLDDQVDLIIPRGSNEFVKYIMHNSDIPVLGHADGICHIYVDSSANPEKALAIINDSKTQYVAVCNAVETVLVHSHVARDILPRLAKTLAHATMEIRGCPRSQAIEPSFSPAVEEDWKCEYLDYILAIKIVDSLEEAVEHINRYGSGHTDAIVSSDGEQARRFMNSVDTASALWNCSTRFADGFRYGLGAEVGISTNKIHARGPVGMEGLTIYQWQLVGDGHIVEDYTNGSKKFIHKDLDGSDYPFGGRTRINP